VLLSDPTVTTYINESFVPCWETVRPVPKVTIDFGDGRTLQRTLGGNTVFSVLLPDGRVLDALPGIYTAGDFRAETAKVLELFKTVAGQPEAEVDRAVLDWHKAQVTQAISSEARRITLSKAMVESPLLSALSVDRRDALTLGLGTARPPSEPAGGTNAGQKPAARDPLADPKAAFAALTAKIEDVSKQPASADRLKATYARQPQAKQPTAEELGRMVVQMDSQNNVRLVRPAVHLLFAATGKLPTARECRDAVYREILHTPVDDPYLGLTAALVPGTRSGE
jgi:hypothetical protein